MKAIGKRPAISLVWIGLTILACVLALDCRQVAAAEPAVIRGDVDGDKAVTWWDYQALSIYLRSPSRFKLLYKFDDSTVMAAADFDGDKAITPQDLRSLQTLVRQGPATQTVTPTPTTPNTTPTTNPTTVEPTATNSTGTDTVSKLRITQYPRLRPTTEPTVSPISEPPTLPSIDNPIPLQPEPVTTPTETASVPLTAKRIDMSVNLNMVTYYTPAWVFTDAFKQSQPWLSQTATQWNDGRVVATDENGWPLVEPGQWAGCLIYRDIDGRYPAGQYVCTYEGKGKITFAFDGKVATQAAGRIVVSVTPSNNGILMRITESDPLDPVRNIRLWLPGFENSNQTFHPVFLDNLRGYKVLRFMDWGRTNNSTIATWSQRTRPEMATQAGNNGVALEYMIDLCNELNADAWLCIPHMADDDYVRNMAQLVKARLRPNRKVYIEYSNEVWNWMFTQTVYTRDKGKELGLSTNDGYAVERYYSQRVVEVTGIFEQVFGGTGRLVRVMASQSANPWTSEQRLTWQDAWKNVDALAIAPYFGAGGIEKKMPGATVDDVIELSKQTIMGSVNDHITLQKQVADQHGLPLIAYEGGQHLTKSNDAALAALFIAANRDPRMYDLYKLYFNLWSAKGGGVFAHFNDVRKHDKWGSWGMMEYQDQTEADAPKLKAIKEALKGRLPFVETNTAGLQSLGVFD